MSDLSNPAFHDENAAREWLEARIWANGRVCPHCGAVDESTLMKGKSHRPGLYQCNACRQPFTVTIGTLYERSHIPLHKWLAATHLMMASKKGMSAMQIHRMLGISYKTAWFMCHRIRESLRGTDLDTPLGGEDSFVEADETFVGGKARNRAYRKPAPKKAVVALVERKGGVRSLHVPEVSADNLRPILEAGVNKASHLRTDESGIYWKVGEEFASHKTVNHSAKEYVRGDASTNAAENYFSILKRGIYGTYHHVSAAHLHRYLAEFDFRYSNRVKLGINDRERMEKSIPGIVGKRLTYRRTNSQAGEAHPA